MKNLKNLNLVELNAQEIMKIEGGAWPKWVKGGLIGYIASELIDNWDDFEKGFFIFLKPIPKVFITTN